MIERQPPPPIAATICDANTHRHADRVEREDHGERAEPSDGPPAASPPRSRSSRSRARRRSSATARARGRGHEHEREALDDPEHPDRDGQVGGRAEGSRSGDVREEGERARIAERDDHQPFRRGATPRSRPRPPGSTRSRRGPGRTPSGSAASSPSEERTCRDNIPPRAGAGGRLVPRAPRRSSRSSALRAGGRRRARRTEPPLQRPREQRARRRDRGRAHRANPASSCPMSRVVGDGSSINVAVRVLAERDHPRHPRHP